MAIIDVSFIIPVYNRPEEINELLSSFNNLDGNYDFEIVIIEDGSVNCSYANYFENNSYNSIFAIYPTP